MGHEDRQVLPFRAKLMILSCFTECEKSGRGNHWKKTCTQLHCSKQSISNVLAEFEKHGCLVGSNTNSGNQTNHQRIIESPKISQKIIEFVRERQRNGEATYTKRIQRDVLVPLDIEISDRALREHLNRIGLTCDLSEAGWASSWENALHYEEHMYVRQDRWNYLSTIDDARFQLRPIVYVDESFFYATPTTKHLGWFDPHLKRPKLRKGRRANIISAITDDNKVLDDATLIFEKWQRLAKGHSKNAIKVTPASSETSAASSSSNNVCEKVPKDDFDVMLNEFVRKKKRKKISLKELRRTHFYFCANPAEPIEPLNGEEFMQHLHERDMRVENDAVLGFEMKKEVPMQELICNEEERQSDWITQDYGVECTFCGMYIDIEGGSVQRACCSLCTGEQPLGVVTSAKRTHKERADFFESSSDSESDNDVGESKPAKKRKRGHKNNEERQDNDFDKYLDADFFMWWFEYHLLRAQWRTRVFKMQLLYLILRPRI